MHVSSRIILIVDGRTEVYSDLERMLAAESVASMSYSLVPTAAAARTFCHTNLPDALVLADELPDGDGLALLVELIAAYGKLAFALVMLVDADREQIGMQARRLGAHDYLIRHANLFPDLRHAVTSALEQVELRRQNAALERQVAFGGLVQPDIALSQSVLDSVSDQIAVDGDSTIRAVNASWLRFGRDRGRVMEETANADIGANYLAICQASIVAGEADAQVAYDGIRPVLDGRQARFRMEYRCDSPQAPGWFSMTVTPLIGGNGAVVVHSDNTEHRQTERALALREAQFAGTINAAMDAIITLDSQQRIIGWNSAAERMFGCPAAEVLGLTLDRFVPERYRESHRAQIEAFGASGETARAVGHQRPLTALRADGTEFLIEASISHMQVDGVLLYTSIIRDITESVRAANELHQSEAKYRMLFEAMYEGFSVQELIRNESGVVVDARYTLLNPALERQSHLKVVDVLGKRVSEIAPAYRDFSRHQRVANSGRSERYEEYLVDMQRWYSVTFFPYGENQIAILYDDITERKVAEERLQRAAQLDAFRVRLNDTLRWLGDPIAIQSAATRLLGEQLHANRVCFVEVYENESIVRQDYTDGANSLVGSWPNGDFSDTIKMIKQNGGTTVCNDITQLATLSEQERAAYSAIGVAAQVVVTLMKDERIVGNLGVHSTSPRVWTPDEVLLVQETAQRTWEVVERASAERARRASDERFRAVIENSAEGVVLLDADERVMYISPNVSSILGYSSDEFRLLSVQEIMHPDDWANVQETRAKLFVTPNAKLQHIVRIRHKDGSWRWVERSMVNQLHNAALQAMIVNFRDVTERIMAEQAHREAQERFRKVFQASPLPIIISTFEPGRIIDVNRSFLDLTGYQIEEVVGKTSTDLNMWVEPAGRERLIEQLQRYGRLYDADQQVRTKLGGLRDVLLSVEPIEFDGSGPYVLTLMHDITERKRAEQELRASQKQLLYLSMRLVNAQEDERRMLAYELHDEIGQQLTGLNLALQISQGESIDQLRARYNEVQQFVNSLTRQVRELSLNLRPSMLDTMGLLPTLRWYIERYMQQSGVAVDFKHSGLDISLPAYITITIYRIVQESLTNIARHAQTPIAQLSIWWSEHQLKISIEDQGRGFEPSTTLIAGRSLGLIAMQERVRLLGGQFTIDSAPGEGTHIRVTLPLDGV